jgi:hypothetical protein
VWPTEQVLHDRAAAGVREISEKFQGAVLEQGPAIELHAIRMVDFHAWVIAEAFLERRGKTRIELDEDQPSHLADEVLAERSRAWTDLDHRIVRRDFKLRNDPAGHVRIDQKILAKLFAWQHAGVIQHFSNFPTRHRLCS